MALPYELIYDEILCRLPVKCLLRYRCVSKEWCSIIDSNAFVKKHLEKAIECNPDGDGVIILGDGQTGKYYLTNLQCLYANEDVAVTEINDPLKTVLSNSYFVGTANCLACFCKKEKNEFIVLNPSTRKYKMIPSMPRDIAFLFDLVKISQSGFGYDHVNDDYKLVRIAQFKQEETNRFRVIMVMVYSLKSNIWTRIHNVPSDINLITPLGMYNRGALHWLAAKFPSGDIHDLIVGFDLGIEQFKELPFPSVVRIFLVPSVGSLCVLDKCTNSRMDVWLINNYATKNPWYNAFSLEQPGAIGSFKFIRPVAFSKRGKDVLIEVDYRKLVWYDPETKVVKNVRIHRIPVKFGSHLYRESLFQLTNNDQRQKPSEDKKKKQQKKRDDFLSKGFELKL